MSRTVRRSSTFETAEQTDLPRGWFWLTDISERKHPYKFAVKASSVSTILPWADYRTVRVDGIYHYVEESVQHILAEVRGY